MQLDLSLAGAAAHADAAALALQMAPAAHQARSQVLQPGQFDLKFAFVALCAGGEDLENQRSAVSHRHAQHALEVALLRRRDGLVEQHGVSLVGIHQQLDLVGLAGADEQRRIGRGAAGDDLGDWRVARGLGQQSQLVQAFVEATGGGVATEIDTHKNGARRLGGRRRGVGRGRGQGGGYQASAGASPAWKLTARPGTTVEIACL